MEESIDRGIGLNSERIIVSEHVRENLEVASQWGRFIALGGFFLSGFLFVMSLISIKVALTLQNEESRRFRFVVAGVTFFLALIFLFPSLRTQRFCTNIRRALKEDDQSDFEVGVDYLKILFRGLGLYALILIAILLLLGSWYLYLEITSR